jgi:hypothetical protein
VGKLGTLGLSILLLGQICWANAIEEFTIQSALAITNQFSQNLMKGKLDKSGYESLRRRISLDSNECLSAWDPIRIFSDEPRLNSQDFSSYWSVGVYKTSKYTTRSQLTFTVSVKCWVSRCVVEEVTPDFQ